jgi:hypothetical protein
MACNAGSCLRVQNLERLRHDYGLFFVQTVCFAPPRKAAERLPRTQCIAKMMSALLLTQANGSQIDRERQLSSQGVSTSKMCVMCQVRTALVY